MTLSARASTFGGIVRPICLEAFRLIMNSNFFGCSTGRSPGFAPFRILSTIIAVWRAGFAISVASVVFVLLRIEPVKRLVGSLWSDHFRSVLYASCFAFGLVHILTFRFTSVTAESLLLAPLLVFPQIIGGFIMAFARMRLGMISSIVLHVAHNFLLLLLTSGQVRPRS
jgi:hypothetical protein